LLAKGDASFQENARAIRLANKWRACHAYPINTFQATLRSKLRNYSCDSIVAQRLKRMPTIIDKLRRYPHMQLTTMQDIGGVRAVLESMKDVKRLVQEYKEHSRFRHELVDEKNYILLPRSEDGYRSHHLVYKYRNIKNPAYDGLRVELQIRTNLQHIWATAVETMGTFLGQALKSRQGDQEWLDFFAVTSSAFAHQEESPLVPRFDHLSLEDTYRTVAKVEASLGAIDRMSAFSAAVHLISSDDISSQAYTYHLIILDSLKGVVTVKAFGRDSYEKAVQEYTEAETRAAKGEKIEPVLVSAGRIETLRRAYPSFFLDIGAFMLHVTTIVEAAARY
jgi:putative GTP pyrophosphokinase